MTQKLTLPAGVPLPVWFQGVRQFSTSDEVFERTNIGFTLPRERLHAVHVQFYPVQRVTHHDTSALT